MYYHDVNHMMDGDSCDRRHDDEDGFDRHRHVPVIGRGTTPTTPPTMRTDIVVPSQLQSSSKDKDDDYYTPNNKKKRPRLDHYGYDNNHNMDDHHENDNHEDDEKKKQQRQQQQSSQPHHSSSPPQQQQQQQQYRKEKRDDGSAAATTAATTTAAVIITILSATYGPSESLLLLQNHHHDDDDHGRNYNGINNNNNNSIGNMINEKDEEMIARIPLTRDCTPFLQELLIAARDREEEEEEEQEEQEAETDGGGGSDHHEDGQNQQHHHLSDSVDIHNHYDVTRGGILPPNPSRCLHQQQHPFSQQHQEQQQVVNANNNDDDGDDNNCCYGVKFRTTVNGQNKLFVSILNGGGGRRSMNAYFGDPCPGTSKHLQVHYQVTTTAFRTNDTTTNDNCYCENQNITIPSLQATNTVVRTEVYRTYFAEHEPVVLRRRLDTVTTLSSSSPLKQQHKAEITTTPPTTTGSPGRSWKASTNVQTSSSSISCWSLDPTTSEVVLPLVLPFLEIRERVQCRTICHCWKGLIREWGVATMIDVNDRNSMLLLSRTTTTTTTTANNDNNNNNDCRSNGNNSNSIVHQPGHHLQQQQHQSILLLSRPVLRGILSHSYSSLQSLFLGGFYSIQKDDLHPALTQLQNLKILDVTRCTNLDDSTLHILSNDPIKQTLRVLYLKGLHKVTDDGLKAVCTSCRTRLEVLDISHISNITDDGASSIQQLKQLRALFLRDNYNLTNEGSLDVITQRCTKLVQLTVWGCINIRYIQFGQDTSPIIHDDDVNNIKGNDDGSTSLLSQQQQQDHGQSLSSSGSLLTTTISRPSACTINDRITILNLWGCYSLDDSIATVLGNMPNLSTLIVTECHRLTDKFVQGLVTTMVMVSNNNPALQQHHLQKGQLQHYQQHLCRVRLRHLHLRYLKRISDASLLAIGQNLHESLYSLDVSFCSRLTAHGIYRLLDSCRYSLVELRLQGCRNLQISRRDNDDDENDDNNMIYTPNGTRPSHRTASSTRRRQGEQQQRPELGTSSRHHLYDDRAGHWILNGLRRPYDATSTTTKVPLFGPCTGYGHTLCLLDVRGCGGQHSPNVDYPLTDPFVVGMSSLQFEQQVSGFFSRPATLTRSVRV